jgi:hypothetical protein
VRRQTSINSPCVPKKYVWRKRLNTDQAAGSEFVPKTNRTIPANESHFVPTAAPARHLVLEEGASRVMRSQESNKKDELWLGDAFDPHVLEMPSISVYIRLAKPTPLVAELLCTVIARALGLPAPEPFIISVLPGTLPASLLPQNDSVQLCVGTRDLGGESFAQLLRSDSATAEKILAKWKHLVPVTVLDEWLANDDRNTGNFIYIAQALHIIDHAEAFGGSMRNIFPLADITEDAFTNRLASMLKGNSEQRQKWLDEAKQWLIFTASGLDISSAVAAAEVKRWQTPEEEAELVHFITTRLSITHRLLCTRLGHPQLPLPNQSDLQ